MIESIKITATRNNFKARMRRELLSPYLFAATSATDIILDIPIEAINSKGIMYRTRHWNHESSKTTVKEVGKSQAASSLVLLSSDKAIEIPPTVTRSRIGG